MCQQHVQHKARASQLLEERNSQLLQERNSQLLQDLERQQKLNAIEVDKLWTAFEPFLRGSAEQTGVAEQSSKLLADPEHFVFGTTDEFMHGMTLDGGLTRSIEQEFASNESGRWMAEYLYVVKHRAIAVPDAPSDDPAFINAAQRFVDISPALTPFRRRDAPYDGMALDDFARHEDAVKANLTRAEVAALRLYTGPAFEA